MTFEEMYKRLEETHPDKDISKYNLAHALMIPNRATVEEWRKNNLIPETYVPHVEKMIQQWKDFYSNF